MNFELLKTEAGPYKQVEVFYFLFSHNTSQTFLRTHKSRQKLPSGHHRTICRAISSQLRHVSTIRKKLVKQQLCPPDVSTIWWTSAY